MALFDEYTRAQSRVKMFVTRGALKIHGSTARALERVPTRIARVMLRKVRRRGKRGKLAGQFGKPYSGKDRKFLISMTYADSRPTGEGIRLPGVNAVVYKNSDELHEGKRPNRFYVSSQLWEALTVVVGARLAKVAFRGRSFGTDRYLRKAKPGEVGTTTPPGRKRQKHPVVVRSKKVSNALKAWTVVATRGINLLAITRQELDGICNGILVAYGGPRSILPNPRWEREKLWATGEPRLEFIGR